MGVKTKPVLSDSQLNEVADIFAALSEASRLKLCRALMSQPLTVTELMRQTGLKQGNVSKHLSVLLRADVVRRTTEGNFARYSLVDHTIHELCRMMCLRVEQRARQRLRAVAS